MPVQSVGSTSSIERVGPRPPRVPADSVALGVVVGAHGLRGQVRVRVLGDGPENLLRVPEVMLEAERDDCDTVRCEVLAASPGRPGEVRMKLAGTAGREEAEAKIGCRVLAESRHLEDLPEGEYYAYQLAGCAVEDGAGVQFGTVREIWPTGASDVLVVEDEAGVRRLVPAAAEFLREVDIENRRIVVEAIPGLFDAV